MIVNRKIDNIDERVKCEFDYVVKKYPMCAFNWADWNGKPNSRETGRNILVATESITTTPNNYNLEILKRYDAIVTYSVKFKELHPELNIYNTQCPAEWEGYHWLEEFKGYDEKLRGICALLTLYNWGHPLDANFMKHKVLVELKTEPHLFQHTFGRNPFGKEGAYQGYLGHKHSNYHNLKKINEYLFCYAAECMSDDFYGHNYMTERVYNAFKSKTVLIYYGAPNIQEILPKSCFVDVRAFKSMDALSQYLIDLSYDKKRYTEMVEEAYLWNLTRTVGDMRYQEEVWQQAIKDNPL